MAKRKFELAYGSLGNGVMVWNSAREVNGDYETIAHISVDRVVDYYIAINLLPQSVIDYVEDVAKNSNPSISVSQPEQKVFREPPVKTQSLF